MEKDRQDLVAAILKLKESINELNQKGREKLLEAFEKERLGTQHFASSTGYGHGDQSREVVDRVFGVHYQ